MKDLERRTISFTAAEANTLVTKGRERMVDADLRRGIFNNCYARGNLEFVLRPVCSLFRTMTRPKALQLLISPFSLSSSRNFRYMQAIIYI